MPNGISQTKSKGGKANATARPLTNDARIRAATGAAGPRAGLSGASLAEVLKGEATICRAYPSSSPAEPH